MTYAQMKQFADVLPKELYLPSSEWVVGGDPRIHLDAGVVAKQKEYLAAFADAGLKPDEGSIRLGPGDDPGRRAARAAGDHDRRLVARPSGASRGQPGVSGLYDYTKSPQRGLTLDDVLITRWDATADKWSAVSQPTGTPIER